MSSSQRVIRLLQSLTQSAHATTDVPLSIDAADGRWLITADAEESQQFWLGVQQLQHTRQLDSKAFNMLLRTLLSTAPSDDRAPRRLCIEPVAARVSQLYRSWHDTTQPRHLLLMLLIRHGGADAWRNFAELLASDPPRDTRQATEACLPIWKLTNGPVQALFPRLLDALQHASVAALVLDLANFLTCQGRLPDHPARPRAADLTWLLGQLTERLEDLEQASQQQGVRDLELAQLVEQSIVLAVALSHTLALLDYRPAIGKLLRLLELQHRRLRVEAAAALARLGEAVGAQALAQLAAEPLVRLRALAYAAELGIESQLPEQFSRPVALAESELVVRLAAPDLFGVAPSAWELVDQRQLMWPGDDRPRACYLFRYTYRFAAGDYVNLAMVGPLTHALMADLTPYAPTDVYAAYAGWQLAPDQLARVELDLAARGESDTIARRVAELRAAGFSSLQPLFWGKLFVDPVLVVEAQREGTAGTVLVDAHGYQWFPQGNPHHPLDAELAYAMFVGQHLLRQLNDDYPDPTRPAP